MGYADTNGTKINKVQLVLQIQNQNILFISKASQKPILNNNDCGSLIFHFQTLGTIFQIEPIANNPICHASANSKCQKQS